MEIEIPSMIHFPTHSQWRWIKDLCVTNSSTDRKKKGRNERRKESKNGGNEVTKKDDGPKPPAFFWSTCECRLKQINITNKLYANFQSEMYVCCDWKCALAYCNDTYTPDCYLIADASALCLALSLLPPRYLHFNQRPRKWGFLSRDLSSYQEQWWLIVIFMWINNIHLRTSHLLVKAFSFG